MPYFDRSIILTAVDIERIEFVDVYWFQFNRVCGARAFKFIDNVCIPLCCLLHKNSNRINNNNNKKRLFNSAMCFRFDGLTQIIDWMVLYSIHVILNEFLLFRGNQFKALHLESFIQSGQSTRTRYSDHIANWALPNHTQYTYKASVSEMRWTHTIDTN